MKKMLKILVLIAFGAFLAIQFHRPARENFPVVQAETIEANTQMPENVKQIFEKSCNDCHTNQTNWRWYSNIAPVSWSMVDHVTEGRKKMNFSVWKSYTISRQMRKLDEICEEIKNDEMPEPYYVAVHWDAKLSAEQKKAVCEWTEKERDFLKRKTAE